ncbi:L-seryl-tRNA(Sec) selenium transferase [Pirellulimonas nuda]|uniref:L-seryl-tRNA(Sec) selenium transferase n=1 Tax=Pirellulimonas nuda TaxID=2528009 RepID=A0A518D9Q5_9BACT|nr:hypothetical protein [Pirellulimonas nuda]QDU88168.1 L-seryl-tRNA(Sec) selenium transferase [Pirellulimonas nuda]
MNPSDFLRQLPSFSDLLKHPRIAPLAEKLSPATVADRVRGFLDEVRAEVGRRVDGAQPPSFQELVEKLSRYITRERVAEARAAINATGALWGPDWRQPPLSAEAIEALRLAAVDFLLAPAAADRTQPSAVESRLATLCGAESAMLFQSRETALLMLLRTHGAKGVAVARGEVGSVSPGCRLTDLAKEAGATLIEVGATDEVTPDDFSSAAAGIVLQTTIDGLAMSGSRRPDLRAMVELCSAQQRLLVVDLGMGPLLDAPSYEGLARQSAQAALAAGADMVVLSGQGLVGGPQCGVVLASSEALAPLRDFNLRRLYELNPLAEAALGATLDLYADPAEAALRIPVWSLLTTPAENLRLRAERMALLLAECPLVSAATAVKIELVGSPLRSSVGGPDSWGVELRPAEMSVSGLAERLAGGSPAIRCRQTADAALLDLRTVFPRQDLEITAQLGPSEQPPASGVG